MSKENSELIKAYKNYKAVFYSDELIEIRNNEKKAAKMQEMNDEIASYVSLVKSLDLCIKIFENELQRFLVHCMNKSAEILKKDKKRSFSGNLSFNFQNITINSGNRGYITELYGNNPIIYGTSSLVYEGVTLNSKQLSGSAELVLNIDNRYDKDYIIGLFNRIFDIIESEPKEEYECNYIIKCDLYNNSFNNVPFAIYNIKNMLEDEKKYIENLLKDTLNISVEELKDFVNAEYYNANGKPGERVKYIDNKTGSIRGVVDGIPIKVKKRI